MILYSPDYENNPFQGFSKMLLVEKQADIKKDGCLLLWGGEDMLNHHQIVIHSR